MDNNKTTETQPSWREQAKARYGAGKAAGQRHVTAVPWKRLGLGLAALLIAAVAGFAGGRWGATTDNAAMTGTLLGQKEIVTQHGELINKIATDVNPSVVSINVTATTTSSDFMFGPQTSEQQAAGTGIIITKSGIIMTNRHVVPAGTTSVSVTLADGTEYKNVKVLGRTSQSDSLDIAFLKISDLKGKTLTPATLGDSSQAKVGDSVVAIGNALGQFQNTVTSGIISGFGRSVEASSDGGSFGTSGNTEDLGNLIQTDAAINEGNSGGPLVNMNGQVIGVNTAIASNAENIGFAIPINDLKGLIDQVLKTGSFERPFLGVRYAQLDASIAKQYNLSVDSGAYIIPERISGQPAVVSGSPAERAGLKAGDIITKVDGTSVTADQNLTTLLNKHQPGDVVTLTVNRGGKIISVTVTLGSADANS